jgi:hypothetical protein
MKRTEVVAEVRKLKGVAWKHEGRTRHGIDCAGVVIVVGNAFGQYKFQPLANYTRRPDGTYVSHFRRHLIEKPVARAKDGDVVLFSESTHPCHCGIITTMYGKPAVVHAHALRGTVIEETLVSAESVVGQPTFCFAYPGIED